ncbi:hypothetical protein SOVF_081320 [Spinacia oleracea]|nr:hypothetical protein SOVF_081320 [Spinacia oleracea]
MLLEEQECLEKLIWKTAAELNYIGHLWFRGEAGSHLFCNRRETGVWHVRD